MNKAPSSPRKRSKPAKIGRPAKYPWGKWFDGTNWVLRRGKGFWLAGMDGRRFSAVIHNQAKRANVRVSLSHTTDELTLQAFPGEAYPLRVGQDWKRKGRVETFICQPCFKKDCEEDDRE